jgi:uncharacterized protein YdeI (YjbR/CyaY-like superfamily)
LEHPYLGKPMEMSKTLHVTDRRSWRAWLEKHHGSEREVWLIYYKKQTGKPRIPYEDAVEEALCFGWIDSIVQRIDDERYAQKFTPRKMKSEWSELNKKRIRKLIREGKMTRAGLVKITGSAMKKPARKKPTAPRSVPNYMRRALMKDKAAWKYFNTLAPSHQKAYILWISQAKKELTRERRLKEAVKMLRQNQKLGLK